MRPANVDCMEAMRVSWTDERLDDLNGKVAETNRRIDDLSREMHAEFRAVRAEMKSMTTAMISGFATLFAANLGVVAVILAQH